MKNINVEVISTNIIKPSIPTPEHLHHYKFSLLDQFSPSFYQPFIYFYTTPEDNKFNNNEVSNHLKTSLSEVLTRYYPLTGCLEETYVDCNNGGVLFLEAQVSCQLSEIVENPSPGVYIDKFLPDGVTNLVLAIQINFFKCGGVALGVRLSHKIADALSLVTFINDWATIARGDGDNIWPEFVTTTLFPPKDGINVKGLPEENNIACKRFVFTSSKIAALREKYVGTRTNMETKPPTRVEALSSFLWSRYVACTKMNEGPEKLYMWINPVNIRKRMDPPLHDDSFGNLGAPSMCIVSSEDDSGEACYGLPNKLRGAISKINKDFLKRLRDGIFEHSNLEENTKANRTEGEELGNFYCSSFCRFPVYKADFGWGKPTWVAVGCLPYKNLIVLMDTKSGDGIEVWVQLTEEDMTKFDADPELLNYASPTLGH